ncbi:MAG: DUF4236 domain-containing protein [Desulfobacterota bacterium U4-17]
MWRFRKIFGRGAFRWTLSKRGIGWSWGILGLRYGVSCSGERYISFRIPGTGFYWIKYLKQRRGPSAPTAVAPPAVPSATPPNPRSMPASPGNKAPSWKQEGL